MAVEGKDDDDGDDPKKEPSSNNRDEECTLCQISFIPSSYLPSVVSFDSYAVNKSVDATAAFLRN